MRGMARESAALGARFPLPAELDHAGYYDRSQGHYYTRRARGEMVHDQQLHQSASSSSNSPSRSVMKP